ncbi:unnamed protein product [Amoebophrya sp. A120]|nr:unnamed protein product [Amoebophrya sp. A120]|eukprot:GSA120T00008313001.1
MRKLCKVLRIVFNFVPTDKSMIAILAVNAFTEPMSIQHPSSSDVYGAAAPAARTPRLPPRLPTRADSPSPSWRLKLEAMQNEWTGSATTAGAPGSSVTGRDSGFATAEKDFARRSLSLLRGTSKTTRDSTCVDPTITSDEELHASKASTSSERTTSPLKSMETLGSTAKKMELSPTASSPLTINKSASNNSNPTTATEQEKMKTKLLEKELLLTRAALQDAKGELEIEKVMHEADKLTHDQQDEEALMQEIERQAGELTFVRAQLSHAKERERTANAELVRLRGLLATKAEESSLQSKTSHLRNEVESVLSRDLKEELTTLRRDMEQKVAARDREIKELRDEAEEREQIREEKEQEALRLLVQQAQLKTEVQKLECDQITRFVSRSDYEQLQKQLADAFREKDEIVAAKNHELEVTTTALREELEEAKQAALQVRQQLEDQKASRNAASSPFVPQLSSSSSTSSSGAFFQQQHFDLNNNLAGDHVALTNAGGASSSSNAPTGAGTPTALRATLAKHRGEIQAIQRAKDNLEALLLEELHELKSANELKEKSIQEQQVQMENLKLDAEERIRKKMRDFTLELRSMFEQDWQEEEEALKLSYDTKISQLEDALTTVQKSELKAVEEVAELRAGLSLAERQLQQVQEKQYEMESYRRRELVAKEELQIRCESSEQDVEKLRQELHEVINKAEDDHLAFRSAEACLQQELLQLRKKILKTELQQELDNGTAGGYTTSNGSASSVAAGLSSAKRLTNFSALAPAVGAGIPGGRGSGVGAVPEYRRRSGCFDP